MFFSDARRRAPLSPRHGRGFPVQEEGKEFVIFAFKRKRSKTRTQGCVHINRTLSTGINGTRTPQSSRHSIDPLSKNREFVGKRSLPTSPAENCAIRNQFGRRLAPTDRLRSQRCPLDAEARTRKQVLTDLVVEFLVAVSLDHILEPFEVRSQPLHAPPVKTVERLPSAHLPFHQPGFEQDLQPLGH